LATDIVPSSTRDAADISGVASDGLYGEADTATSPVPCRTLLTSRAILRRSSRQVRYLSATPHRNMALASQSSSQGVLMSQATPPGCSPFDRRSRARRVR
jgi:hypothetical protein